jgi:hypothetical protein
MLDYSVATTFFVLGARYRGRNNRAAALAFINGAMVLGMLMLTGDPGGIWRRLTFKTHRPCESRRRPCRCERSLRSGLTA